jgi:hypothetical protein
MGRALSLKNKENKLGEFNVFQERVFTPRIGRNTFACGFSRGIEKFEPGGWRIKL